MDPSEFATIKEAVPGSEDADEPEFVFGFPERFGGKLTNALPDSSAERDAGMMAFDIRNTS